MDASDKQADIDRGIRYSDGGIAWGVVCYPDPAAIARCHAEWAHLEEEGDIDE